MKHVDLYADGACSGNPGAGGYGVILRYKEREKCASEGFPETTNNRMELSGVIAGLSLLTEPCEVTVYTDSQYVVNGMEKGWAKKWKKAGWMKGDKTPAMNPDLWDRLLTLAERHRLTFIWIRGHNGHDYNERCDAMAREAIMAMRSQ